MIQNFIEKCDMMSLIEMWEKIINNYILSEQEKFCNKGKNVKQS